MIPNISDLGAIFDTAIAAEASVVILTRPAPELSDEERKEVKRVARELLDKLKRLIVLDWRQRAGSRSQVKMAIEDLLDEGLPRVYSPEMYQQKCAALFQHFYENYSDRDKNTYSDISA